MSQRIALRGRKLHHLAEREHAPVRPDRDLAPNVLCERQVHMRRSTGAGRRTCMLTVLGALVAHGWRTNSVCEPLNSLSSAGSAPQGRLRNP